MALRLRRDVQKASYYVWFLGAEEAKGLRGARVINSVLPYLIDRSRSHEPLKVTLQVSHKGIKILQGSSKHFIPHSAITSSIQIDDTVACILLLYNPVTKCPLHVHGYRCDSESTAEALHQQLQILINRPENQKRFEELETRLGIMAPLPSPNKPKALTHITQNQKPPNFQKQQNQRRNGLSPGRFVSSLGSDTGNSTRESDCSEEHNSVSPISHSPPIVKPSPQNNELFDSLAAELRAKLNGNGPPILLPPRDYDTVHRSKGNLTAIELRRCRNSLIVGGALSNANATQGVPTAGKQISSRGSSGIGSDLAPSPERQELNSSSDDDHWSNEADNSVIALKPSQIQIEHSIPNKKIPQINRKSTKQPPEDSYLRDLPAKPYTPYHTGSSSYKQIASTAPIDCDSKTKSSSTTPWCHEDEIKPIIVRPTDYGAKFNQLLQSECKQVDYNDGNLHKAHVTRRHTDHNRLLVKKPSLEDKLPKPNFIQREDINEELEDSDPSSDQFQAEIDHDSHQKENLTDKQKFMEYTSKKQSKKPSIPDIPHKYEARQRYVDPADLPFDRRLHNRYAAVHRASYSPDRSVSVSTEPQPIIEVDIDECQSRQERLEHYPRKERNPYKESESIPYIESMEKMIKSSAMRYKSFQEKPNTVVNLEEETLPVQSQRSQPFPKHGVDLNEDHENPYSQNISNFSLLKSSCMPPRGHFTDTKDKFHVMERSGRRYNDMASEKADSVQKSRGRNNLSRADSAPLCDNWSDEERIHKAANLVHSRPHTEWVHNEMHRDNAIQRDENIREHHAKYIRNPENESKATKMPNQAEQSRRHGSREARISYNGYDHDSHTAQRQNIKELIHEVHRGSPNQRRVHTYSPGYERCEDSSVEPSEFSQRPRPEFPYIRPMENRTSAHVNPERFPHGSSSSNELNNRKKGYRHSYAEPVLARTGGRVGLAAVNPF